MVLNQHFLKHCCVCNVKLFEFYTQTGFITYIQQVGLIAWTYNKFTCSGTRSSMDTVPVQGCEFSD